jgi:hypothetical protein
MNCTSCSGSSVLNFIPKNETIAMNNEHDCVGKDGQMI